MAERLAVEPWAGRICRPCDFAEREWLQFGIFSGGRNAVFRTVTQRNTGFGGVRLIGCRREH